MVGMKIAIVEWIDACSSSGVEHTREECRVMKPVVMCSVGELVVSDKDKVLLGFCGAPEYDDFKIWQLIPRRYVKKMKVVDYA